MPMSACTWIEGHSGHPCCARRRKLQRAAEEMVLHHVAGQTAAEVQRSPHAVHQASASSRSSRELLLISRHKEADWIWSKTWLSVVSRLSEKKIFTMTAVQKHPAARLTEWRLYSKIPPCGLPN